MDNVIIGKELNGFGTNKGTKKDIIDFFNNYKILEDFMILGKIYCCNFQGKPHAYGINIKDFIKNTFIDFPKDIELLYFIQGTQFAVSAERIRTKPNTFYKNLLKELHKNEFNTHILERLWMYIFSNKIK